MESIANGPMQPAAQGAAIQQLLASHSHMMPFAAAEHSASPGGSTPSCQGCGGAQARHAQQLLCPPTEHGRAASSGLPALDAPAAADGSAGSSSNVEGSCAGNEGGAGVAADPAPTTPQAQLLRAPSGVLGSVGSGALATACQGNVQRLQGRLGAWQALARSHQVPSRVVTWSSAGTAG